MEHHTDLVPPARTSPVAPRAPDAGSSPVIPEIDGTEARLRGYLQAIHRRRLVVAGTIAAAVAVTVAYTQAGPRVYEARARVLLEAGGHNVVTFAPVLEDRPNAEYYNTQYEIFRSRALAERVIDRLGVWSNPDVAGGERTSRWRRVLAAMKWRDPSARPAMPTEAPISREARVARVGAFLNRLRVSPVKQSRIVEVSFRSPDPVLAAKVANTVSQVYIEQSLDARARPTTEAASSLRQALETQKKEVQASEEALQRYRERHQAVALKEGHDIVVQKLAQLSAAATTAKTTRIEKAALYTRLRSIQDSRASLDTFPDILSDGFIQGLKSELAALQQRQAQLGEQLGDLHPEMIQLRGAIAGAEARLKTEVGKAAEAVRQEYLAAEGREQALVRALEEQQRQVLARDRTSIELSSLERTAATNRQIYETLLQRSKETEVSSSVQAANARVVDVAEIPGTPLPTGAAMYGLLAVVWGGALGVGLIFVLEFFDKGIKSAAEVQKYLALPCLGVAPELGRSVDLQRLDGVPFEFTEAIRSISATLLNSASRMPRSVLVTSANAREGKTLVAGHLALALAQVGQRVLLVDADLRRSRVHELLASNRGPGLSDLLRGSARLGSVMRKPVSGEFWFIPAGSPRADSANLLGTERLGQLIDQLTSAFDWVIVDSPPVLAVADTGFITKAVSAVLLVVGANSATRDAVQAAIDRLESLNAKPFGVVLNRTTRGEQTDYSHGQYRPEHESQYSTTPSASARA